MTEEVWRFSQECKNYFENIKVFIKIAFQITHSNYVLITIVPVNWFENIPL